MENLIILTIDALSYKVLSSYPFREELFIFNTFHKKSHDYRHYYTQGPYTEASVNGMICGQEGLDCGSFMYGMSKCPEDLFSVLNRNGYTVLRYGASNELYEDCQETVYRPSFISTIAWSRLPHFETIHKTRGLTEAQYRCCFHEIRSAIKKTIRYCDSYIGGGASTEMMRGYLHLNEVVDLRKRCLEKLSSFQIFSPEIVDAYLDRDARSDWAEIRNRIPNYPRSSFGKIYAKYSKSIISHLRRHLSWEKPQFKKVIRGFAASIKHMRPGYFLNAIYGEKRSFAQSYATLMSPRALERKCTVSFSRRIDQAIGFIEQNSSKPFFLYMQPDDFHPMSAFHSYDSNNPQLVESELAKAHALAKRIPSSYKCNIATFLSIRYIDENIRRLWDYLVTHDLLENTKIIITADHGYWEYRDARHPKELIMSEERLHIPLMIYDVRLSNTQYHDEYIQNYQFPNLVLETLGFETNPLFHEPKPLLPPLICENLGFGCPDIFDIPIHYTIYSSAYKLVVFGRIERAIELEDCVLFFDLSKDPLEQTNVLHLSEYADVVARYMAVAKERHERVRVFTDSTYYLPPNRYEEMYFADNQER